MMDFAGLETYFLSNSQAFASGFNLNSQIAVSNSQLVFAIISETDLISKCISVKMLSINW